MTNHQSKGIEKEMVEDEENSPRVNMFNGLPGGHRKRLAGNPRKNQRAAASSQQHQTQSMFEKLSAHEDSLLDQEERKRRLTDAGIAIWGTPDQRQTLQQLFNIGGTLRTIRIQQRICLDKVASNIGCSPQHLGYLESGLASVQEFRDAIYQWTQALGVNTEEYKQMLPSPTRTEGKKNRRQSNE